jgi:hypothetical protein
MLCDAEGELISPPIWTSFQDRIVNGRLALDYGTTKQQLQSNGIELREGLRLVIYDQDGNDQNQWDDLLAVATIAYDDEPDRWSAFIEPGTMTHFSELDERCKESYRRFRPNQGEPMR